MIRHLFFLAALVLAASAFSVVPHFIDVQDTGSESLPSLDVGISLDCDSKNVTVTVLSDDDGTPVAGADARLFYTDYTYQPLPNPGKTDSKGMAGLPVPGTLKFLNAMFVLRVDKQGFKSREIEFAYEYCFDPPPAEDTEGDAGADETPSEDVPVAADDASDAGAAGNEAQDEPAATDVDGTGAAAQDSVNDSGAEGPVSPPPQGSPACPAGFILLALLFSRMRA